LSLFPAAPAPTHIYTLSLHDALPISNLDDSISTVCCGWTSRGVALGDGKVYVGQLDGRLLALDQKSGKPVWSIQAERWQNGYTIDRKSTRLNSSHSQISYAVFCLKKK